jgi:UDP-galactopyranose mutase
MLDDADLLIAGAGPVGCVIAERAANLLGWKVLLVDRRPHLAGNCYDSRQPNGVLVHNYGPHYFRTNDKALLDYLSQFTDWIPGNYRVQSFAKGRLFPFPINLTTLEQCFGRRLDVQSAERLLAELRAPIENPGNSEEYVLSKVGRELYETFYLNYTQKQWGLHPRELAPTVCGRIPVRLNRDQRYVDQRYQVMPRHGFTALFARMVRHRKIHVLLDCPFQEVRALVMPRQATVYTGPIDDYFDCRLGRLPYRSLKFDFVPFRTTFVQPCVQINYPNEFPWTRSVEYKHVTGQRHPETVLSFETPTDRGEPYYPVATQPNLALYHRYQELAAAETRQRRVFFCGRLAQYRYFNTDDAILEALKCFQEIQRTCQASPRASALSPAPALV